MTDNELEQTLEVLSGDILLRCVECKEAIPWLASGRPRWNFVHESIDGYPNCISKWDHGSYATPAMDELHNRVSAGRAKWIKPTEEQLRRARAVKR